MERDNHAHSWLGDTLRAHALQFKSPLAPTHGQAVGNRILVSFLVVGIGAFFVLRFVLDGLGVSGLPVANLIVVVALLAVFVVAQRTFVDSPMASVGLRRFVDWTRRERMYFFQVVPLASVVFAIVFGGHLQALLARHDVAGFLLFSVFTGLIWGMVQEFFYRGWLQTELTRRFGAIIGLLLANIVFTLGPLHLNYLTGPAGVHWGGLAAVFGIGLFFGIIYARSGNLWIPAVMHGIWPPNMS